MARRARACARPRYADHSRETFDGALDTAERIATEVFLPHRRKADQQEPEFDGERVQLIPETGVAFAAFAEAGLLAASQDYEYGGMQLPAVVDQMPAKPRSTRKAWAFIDRKTKTCDPTCPRCGQKAFAPNLAQVDVTDGHVVFWCSDHGHWAGDETEVLWVRRKADDP